MKPGFVICRRMEDGTLKHVTLLEPDSILVNDILERLVHREIPTKTGATAEDLFKLMNGEQSREDFMKEHRLDGFGSSARRKTEEEEK